MWYRNCLSFQELISYVLFLFSNFPNVMNMYYSRAVSIKKVKNLALCGKLNCAEYAVTLARYIWGPAG